MIRKHFVQPCSAVQCSAWHWVSVPHGSSGSASQSTHCLPCSVGDGVGGTCLDHPPSFPSDGRVSTGRFLRRLKTFPWAAPRHSDAVLCCSRERNKRGYRHRDGTAENVLHSHTCNYKTIAKHDLVCHSHFHPLPSYPYPFRTTYILYHSTYSRTWNNKSIANVSSISKLRTARGL